MFNTLRLGVYLGIFGVFAILALLSAITGRVERLQASAAEPKRAARRQASLDNSSIILIRDNGVTIYGSKDDAEASMEWADVERNPSRRAFDAKGVEFAFKRRMAAPHSSPYQALRQGADPTMVDLEPRSVKPHPEEFREALINWLGGMGIKADDGIELRTLILLAARTRYGRSAAIGTAADPDASPLGVGTLPGSRRLVERTDPDPDAAQATDEPKGTVVIARRRDDQGCDEDIAIAAVVIIRDNGVTVYDSKEKAEESMEWSDVMRNPSRRAFDLKGRELRFTYRPPNQAIRDQERIISLLVPFRPLHRRWSDGNPKDVALVPTSAVPHPDLLRDALAQWLEGKGVAVDRDGDLGALIARASALKNWRRSAPA